MAGRQYLTDSNSPFFSVDEEDVDDETFLRHNSYCREKSAVEDKRLQLLERKKAIEERTIQSSERSIRLLQDTEQIGVATGEELIRQREQLVRTDKRFDYINNTLRYSGKHIRGIKSVYGSLKNYWSGKSGEQVPCPSFESDDSSSSSRTTATPSPLGSALNSSKANLGSQTDNHPGLKMRGLSGDHDTCSQPDISSGYSANKLIDNLEGMDSYLSRLKGLAQGLNEEIVTQNEMIDRLNSKADKADFTILRQNKEMNKLLKK